MITSLSKSDHPHPPAVCTPFPGAVFPLDQDGSKDFGALQDCIASLPRCAAAPDSQRQRRNAPAPWHAALAGWRPPVAPGLPPVAAAGLRHWQTRGLLPA